MLGDVLTFKRNGGGRWYLLLKMINVIYLMKSTNMVNITRIEKIRCVPVFVVNALRLVSTG
jgi:hypothetical protein